MLPLIDWAGVDESGLADLMRVMLSLAGWAAWLTEATIISKAVSAAET